MCSFARNCRQSLDMGNSSNCGLSSQRKGGRAGRQRHAGNECDQKYADEYESKMHADESSDDELYVDRMLSKHSLRSNDFTNGHLDEVSWKRWNKRCTCGTISNRQNNSSRFPTHVISRTQTRHPHSFCPFSTPRDPVPRINTTKDVMKTLQTGNGADICRHVMLYEELEDYCLTRNNEKLEKSSDGLIDAFDSIDWSVENVETDAFLSNEKWTAHETEFVEFVQFIDAAHEGAIPGGSIALTLASTPRERRCLVFEAMERYWKKELEVIGNGVFGTKRVPWSEVMRIMREISNRGRALRIAVTMELVCD